ncbi:hypothetical protein BGX28_001417 [Mortierella sp. GBA30]|nr:hypothetical protein BGX28_001417 [Mortierella sp. GBA30]
MTSDPLRARQFYGQNNVLFPTGRTGFIEKIILENRKDSEILASGQKVNKNLRIETEIFGCRILETLEAEIPDERVFLDEVKCKVVPAQGDLILDRLGLSEDDLKMVQRDTQCF